MAQQEKMTMSEFFRRFGTEDACRDHLYKMKWQDGFACPKCGAKCVPYNIKSNKTYQCRNCNHQASVTAGTIMDKSRTPLTKWFLAIYLMGQDKRGCSALRLKNELGIAYDTAWTMSHKIRKAMCQRDSGYLLSGTVDIDDCFFGGAHEGSKRGRGTDKTAVVFGVSLDEKGRPQYLKAKVVTAVSGDTLSDFAKENIKPGSLLRCDGYRPYNGLATAGFKLDAKVFDPKQDPDHLKWLHVVVSNAKAFILGTYHGLGDTHLQSYLDEFAFRFGRRFWHNQIFNRIVSACAKSTKYTRYDLIG
jgi:transposase-like protein